MALNDAAITELRAEFPALQQTIDGRPIIFLDGPGGTQAHESVIKAMEQYLIEANSNAHGLFTYSQRTDETRDETRRAMADFLNARRPEEIVFGLNMTSLTFNISRSIGQILEPGDELIVTRLDHDANISPWLALEEVGAVVRWVDFDRDDCTLDMDAMAAAINPRTKLVAVGYASNAVGTINNVARIAEMAHAAGAWIYVDAVHYAPHAPIDVQALDCDFLACSSYKFFGPHQGILYGKYDLLEALPAYKVRPAPSPPPDKFETGTPSFESLAGVTAAVDYLASVGQRFGGEFVDPTIKGRRRNLVAGMTAIHTYGRDLCARMIAGLQAIDDLHIYGITDPARFDQRLATVSFRIEGITPQEIARRLNEANVFVWDGNFYALAVTDWLGIEDKGGLVRIGLAHYNTADEVDTLLGLLSDMPR